MFMEGDIEAAGIEDLAQLAVDGAHDVVGIEPGAHCLSNLREQLVLFAATARLMKLHIMIERGTELSSQALEQREL